MHERKAVDPVCGKEVDVLRARAVGIFGGVTFYFCSSDCKAKYHDPRVAPRVDADSKPVELTPPRPTPPVLVAPVVTIPVARIHSQPHAIVVPEPVQPSDEPAPTTATRAPWQLPLVVLFAGAAIYWTVSSLRHGDDAETPAPAAPVVTAPVVETPVAPGTVAAPAPAPVAPVPPAPVKPIEVAAKARPAVVAEELKPPLKLGLRRFVDVKDGHTDVSLRLLVVDAEDEGHAFEMDRLEVAPDDPAASLPATAVAPREEFVATGTRLGRIFDDAIDAAEERLEVRISRQEDALVAETRRIPKSKDAPVPVRDAPEPAWRTTLRLPLSSTGQLRAAPFARKRYTTTPVASQ